MPLNGVIIKIHEEQQESLLTGNTFNLTDEEKISIISRHFRQIMQTMGLDLEDDSLRDTPERVARMYINEIFSGLNPINKPEITLFENKYRFNEMLVEKNISFFSNCEHHFVPFYGKVHVGYFSSGKIIGLSKINRIVQYYARRPQVQERLTMDIAHELKSILETQDVAVLVDATHLCVSARGVEDCNSGTVSACYEGKFKKEEVRNEFLAYIK